jgi:hypothetical protein
MIPQNEILASRSRAARSGDSRRGSQITVPRSIRCLLPACALVLLLAHPGSAWAQLPSPIVMPAPAAPPAAAPTNSTGNETPFLTGLPNVPDVPSSLYAPATPTYTCSTPECPYFDCDQRLDPFCLPQPGWVADVEVDVNLPHVSNGVHDTVTLGGVTSQVKLGTTRLDWTGSPRVELGYRLPDGFGEFDFSYRFIGSDGNGIVFGPGAAPDGPAAIHSRLDIQEAELSYASNEISICSWWSKWHFGLRGTDIFFDSRADETKAAAALGSGIFERRMNNNYWGLGPSWTLDLERRIGDSAFTVVGRLDGAFFIGEDRQGFFEVANSGATAQTIRSNPQPAPTANWSLGVAWRPPSCQALRCFIGYQGEGWWQFGEIFGASSGSNAQIYTEGVLFRIDYNY